MLNFRSPGFLLLLLLFCAMLFPGCPSDSGNEGSPPASGEGGVENQSGEGVDAEGSTPVQYENGSQGAEVPPPQEEPGEAPGQSGDSILQEACASALGDYPQWALVDTELVIWENADKSFNFRNSPEEPGTGISSPAGESETLADMDFIGENEVSYAVLTDSGWELGLFGLNGMDAPTNSRVYSAAGMFSLVDVSPISREEFIVLHYGAGDTAFIDYLNSSASVSERISEVPAIGGVHKLAVSPKGTYFYLFHDGILELFDVSKREKLREFDSVVSAVWVGDSNILYSMDGGTYIYSVHSGESGGLSRVGSASSLHFIPKGKGGIAYTESGNAKVIGCSNWGQLAFKQGTAVLAFAGNETLIIKKGGNCFWRFFNSDWTLRISDEVPLFATIWGRY
jgi:hypothetical protein